MIHANWWHTTVNCKNGIGSAWCHAQQQSWNAKTSMLPNAKQSWRQDVKEESGEEHCEVQPLPKVLPNKGLQATGNSVRSFLAPAIPRA